MLAVADGQGGGLVAQGNLGGSSSAPRRAWQIGTAYFGFCRMLRLISMLQERLLVLLMVCMKLWSPPGSRNTLSSQSGLPWTGIANEEVLGCGGTCISGLFCLALSLNLISSPYVQEYWLSLVGSPPLPVCLPPAPPCEHASFFGPS